MIHSARRLLNARCEALRANGPGEEPRAGSAGIGGAPQGPSDELSELLHALERMEAGTWGQCEKCGQAIGRDRLRAIPETRWCLQCAKV